MVFMDTSAGVLIRLTVATSSQRQSQSYEREEPVRTVAANTCSWRRALSVEMDRRAAPQLRRYPLCALRNSADLGAVPVVDGLGVQCHGLRQGRNAASGEHESKYRVGGFSPGRQDQLFTNKESCMQERPPPVVPRSPFLRSWHIAPAAAVGSVGEGTGFLRRQLRRNSVRRLGIDARQVSLHRATKRDINQKGKHE